MDEQENQIILPEFLNNQYVEKVLQEYYKDTTIKVSSFESTLAAFEPGNNYVGLVLRCKIHFHHSNNKFVKSFIIKTTLPDPKIKEIVKSFKLFDKEMIMFENILPKYQKLLGKNDVAMCPESVKIDWNNMTLVFEDLSQSNFVVADRKKGVDMTHAKLLMEQLAKYHACSMVLAEREGTEIFKEFNMHIVNDASPEGKSHFKRLFRDLIEEIKTWPGYEKYGEKLEKIEPFFFQQEVDLYKNCRSKIKVLIHGDLWVTNFMFKYDSKNKPIAVKFIDLQIVYYGSPIFDIIYFLVTSVHDEIRFNCQNEIIQIYHESLLSLLKRLNYKGYIPSLFELYQDYVEKNFFEIFVASGILGLVLNDQKEGASIENLLQNTENSKNFRRQMFRNETYRRILKRYLPIWDKKGLLDILHN